MDSRDCMTCAFSLLSITQYPHHSGLDKVIKKKIAVSGYKAICTEGSMEQSAKRTHEAQWNGQQPQ